MQKKFVFVDNIYPFQKNSNILYKSIVKIQKWYKYYHTPHIYYHKNNEHLLILTKYNMIKMLILYLKNPQYNYFREESFIFKKTKIKNKEFFYLYNLSTSYKMYNYLKYMKYNILKNLYLFIKYY